MQVFIVNHISVITSLNTNNAVAIFDFLLVLNRHNLFSTINIVEPLERIMQIEIQALNFSLTNALRGHIERRLGFALSTRDDHIQRIMVRLSDINGPRGGEDKCCHIHVVLPQLPDVVIEDIEEDLYAAIDRAADRVGRTVGRRLARHRDRERSSYPHNQAPLTELHELN
jgi:ribosomal subunit interface protein